MQSKHTCSPHASGRPQAVGYTHRCWMKFRATRVHYMLQTDQQVPPGVVWAAKALPPKKIKVPERHSMQW